MKINFVMLLIALALAILVAYGFYSGNKEEQYIWLITIASGTMGFVTLSGIFAVSFNVRGGTGNVRVVSILFFIVFLVSNTIFSFLPLTLPPYIIINGVLFLIFILLGYKVIKSLQ